MIEINRIDCPKCLQKQDHKFVEQDCRREEVIEALSKMQHQKCCYCERKLSEMGRTEREVEHYMPKSTFKDRDGNIKWHLANKWENLLWARRSCNSKKGSQLPFNNTTNEYEIIDPSCGSIDPENHIDFVVEGFFIVFKEKNGSPLGRSTIDKLKFRERTDLFSRFRKIKTEIQVHFMELTNALVDNDIVQLKDRRKQFIGKYECTLSICCFPEEFYSKRA